MSIPRDNYIGEPQYPDTWTTKTPREGLRDIDEARIVSLAPDVCLTPVGSSVVPIPYPVVDFCGHDKNYTPSVRFTGKKAMVMRSCTTHVHGDAPGNRKGVKSGTVESICEPIGHADQVLAEGSHVIRHLDRFYMNSRNTQGEAIFVRSTQTYDPPKDDDPVRGSLRWQDGSDEGRVMSDASPEPFKEGEKYAYAGSAAAATTGAAQNSAQALRGGMPATRPTVPQTVPRGPGRVITPGPARAPQWYRIPPHRVVSDLAKVGRLARVGIWARRLNVIGILSSVLIPDNGANLSDVVPRDDQERRIKEMFDEGVDAGHDSWEMRDWAMEELRRHRQRVREEPESRPQALPQSETVRVSDRDEYRKKCQVDRYAKMKSVCGQYGMQAHHIVPDWTLRYGAREEADKRIPNMPSLNDGMAICVIGNARVEQTEHWGGHLADKAIENAGRNSTPPFTAPLHKVVQASAQAMISVRPDCAKEIMAALTTQYVGKNPFQLLRAKQYPPLPEETISALKSGAVEGATRKP